MGASETAPAGQTAGDGDRAGRPSGGRLRSTCKRRRLALAAILFVGIAYGTMIQSFSWNQTSHYDLIRSLNVERTNIDAFQQNTGDKVFYKGHWYSARAPGLALFALPFYDTLNALDAPKWARARDAMRGEDEIIYLIGLWGNVLPGLLLLLLVWRVAERSQPGFGAAAAVSLGLGTMILPLSTLLFSHVFTAFLGFGAFALMLRERDGPPSPLLLARRRTGDGLRGQPRSTRCSSSPPCSACTCSRVATRCSPRGVLTRAGAYIAGGIVGIVPLLLYNHYAFDSWTHLAYSDVPRQQQRLLRHRPAQLQGAGHAAVRLARPADDLARADHGSRRHGAALPPRKARRGADDRRHLPAATSATTPATTCPSAAASWARAS